VQVGVRSRPSTVRAYRSRRRRVASSPQWRLLKDQRLPHHEVI
jgi:hypothetical protein